MKQENINKAALLHVSVVFGQEEIRNSIVFPLREKLQAAFKAGVYWSQDQSKAEQNKIVFDFNPEKIVIGFGQSPRGIRIEDKRPVQIELNINQTFKMVALKRFQMYLNELIAAMETRGEIKP